MPYRVIRIISLIIALQQSATAFGASDALLRQTLALNVVSVAGVSVNLGVALLMLVVVLDLWRKLRRAFWFVFAPAIGFVVCGAILILLATWRV